VTAAIGLTLGDPCGIGPELWVRILCDEHARDGLSSLPPLWLFGDPGVLARAALRLSLGERWQAAAAALRLIAVTELLPAESEPGQPSARSGAAQIEYLEAAIRAAEDGAVAGLCTAPIHKASAKAAGLRFPGHTELLAARLPGDGQVVMMLAGPRLRVALCTTHLALAAVPQALSVAGVTQVLRTTALALQRDFAVAAPRLWVAGLNPHAGESGHFGDEESRIIAPAIRAALALPELAPLRAAGLVFEGPQVPDAVFRAAVHPPAGTPRPDAVVAMYHDQGLIPLKLLDFEDAVNVSLGLRVVRTSPDHGVAHDIAGRGLARPQSQLQALRLCAQMTARRAAV
jgi:4-hydroxythreonine-4-phosphate dehydrogenase